MLALNDIIYETSSYKANYIYIYANIYICIHIKHWIPSVIILFAVVVNLPHNSLSCTFLLIENTVPKGIRWLHQVTAFPSYAPTARPANIWSTWQLCNNFCISLSFSAKQHQIRSSPPYSFELFLKPVCRSVFNSLVPFQSKVWHFLFSFAD